MSVLRTGCRTRQRRVRLLRWRSQGSTPPATDRPPVHGITPEVREEARNVGVLTYDSHWCDDQDPPPFWEQKAYAAVDAAVPVIAGAAYKEGLLKARESVEAQAAVFAEVFRLHNDLLSEDREVTLRTAIAALDDLLAAIDKEGEEARTKAEADALAIDLSGIKEGGQDGR
jgi:hypothetical protein